jgi:hypothetical protein
MLVERCTDVDGTVENTACDDVVAVGLNTPLSVIVKSARSSRVSCANLSTPVMSCVALGVVNVQFVQSFVIILATAPES